MRNKVGSFIDIGLDHSRAGIVCQDAVITYQFKESFLIAVSDGAGSAPKSHEGSSLILETIAEEFSKFSSEKRFDVTNVHGLISQGIETFREVCFSKGDGLHLNQYACTLVGVLGEVDGPWVSFHIGDGAIIRVDDSCCELVSAPENGEYSNETYFATMDNWEEHLRLKEIEPAVGSIMVMTDGVTPFALTPEGPFQDFLVPLRNFIRERDEPVISDGLKATLSGQKAQSICRDDKALSWMISGKD